MTLDYQPILPPSRKVPTLRDVGRALIALGVVQWFPVIAYIIVEMRERHPEWPSLEGGLFLGWCALSGLIHIICGVIIRKRLVPVVRWIAMVNGVILSGMILWGLAILVTELAANSGPAQKGGPFFVLFILLGLGIISAFVSICWQMHLIANHNKSQIDNMSCE